MSELPIKVTAYIYGEKEDPNARATFANMSYGEDYARLLANSHRYSSVILWDTEGEAWEIPPSQLVNSDGDPV